MTLGNKFGLKVLNFGESEAGNRFFAVALVLAMVFVIAGQGGAICLTTNPTYYVDANNGDDNKYTGLLAAPNAGKTDGPFRSLGKAQAAMENSSTIKTATVRQGTYSIAAGWTLTPADNGESWLAYQGETPVLDGENTGGINRSGSGNLDTISFIGFTVQNFAGWDISYSNKMTIQFNTFLNCNPQCIFASNVYNAFIDSNHINGVVDAAGNGFAINLDSGAGGNTVSHNLIENAQSGGIGFSTQVLANSNNTVDRNILRNVVTNTYDLGAIYMEDRPHISVGNMITNNTIDGSGQAEAIPLPTHAIYLDDNLSGTTVTGNIVRNAQQFDVIIHGGDHTTIQNNIFDLTKYSGLTGLSPSAQPQLCYYQESPPSNGQYGMAGNVYTKNIVYFAAGAPSALWVDQAVIYNNGQAGPTVTGNMYYSATNATIPNTVFVDQNPISANPQFTNPSAGDYSMPANSPAYTQMGFQALATDRGPVAQSCSTQPGSVTINPATAANFSVQQGQTFSFTTHWAGGPTSVSEDIFIHFVDAGGNFTLQDPAHAPSPSTLQWSGTFSESRSLPLAATQSTGTFKMMAGLYDPLTTNRLALTPGSGVTPDGSLRYQIGTLTVLSPCDVNANGNTDVTDVQGEVNQALHVASCTADINKDGKCDVIDVQRVSNAAVGGQCVTTP